MNEDIELSLKINKITKIQKVNNERKIDKLIHTSN